MVAITQWAGAARRLWAAALQRRLHRLSMPWRLSTGLQAAVLFAAAMLLFSPADKLLLAAEPAGKPTTSRSAQDAAVRAIPLDKLSAESRGKVTAVLNDVSLYRRLPNQAVDCEPDLFRFIMNNPDLMVNIWRVMGVTNIVLDREDATHYRCSDGDGTTARVEVVYRSAQMQVIYAEGLYEGPLFPRPVRGQCVAVLQYASVRKASGRFEETAQLDTFLHVDNIGVEIIAKLFQGLVGRTVDHNFSETVSFVGSVSRTAELNPRGTRRLAAHLDRVEPERREQFIAVADQVAGKMADAKLSDDDDIQPLTDVVQSSALDATPGKNSKR
ncbi:MAG TPA: hypothetical protein VMJ32_17710 [Pirellulales bacterium]|nr:hypothetical protein [Pirellulales bacterium]